MDMGLRFGLESRSRCYIRKNRWLFKIPEVSADGIFALPPNKSSRPNLTFKEIEVPHLTENVYIPGKPDWKPIALTLYDIGEKVSPVFEWLKTLYDPERDARYTPATDRNFIREATLELYSGAGDLLETWIYENCWAQATDFGDLDMSSAEICMCDVTLRYARAYWFQGN